MHWGNGLPPDPIPNSRTSNGSRSGDGSWAKILGSMDSTPVYGAAEWCKP